MFDVITSLGALHLAWRQVRANGAATGGDGETSARFTADLDRRLKALALALQQNCYRPGPLLHVPMRRPDGRIRVLRIPGLADRVIQTAAQQHLSRMLDARMSDASFAYRPGRSVDLALARLCALADRFHRPWVLDADIAAFFDRVLHHRLADDLLLWIADPRTLALISLWLRSFGARRGLAQGAPISPLLANLFLHPLDAAFAREGVTFVRYADDFVTLAPDQAGALAARRLAAGVLERRGLTLHPDKTRVAPLAAGLHFLGRDLVPGTARNPPIRAEK